MQIISDPREMQKTAEKLRMKHQLIAVVMTMGALHEGHLKLIQLARKKAGTVILTIFVNPRQFGEGEDFHRYPKPFDNDAAMAKTAGVDYLFAPEAAGMYPEDFQTTIATGDIASRLEGEQRPGHFNGVVTVVAKLLHITKPHIAVFGEKDAQQLAVIRRMVDDLNFDVSILEAPLMREEDGLAISSRNRYLSIDERQEATVLYRALMAAEDLVRKGCRESDALIEAARDVIGSVPDTETDYISLVDAATFREVDQLQDNHDYRMLLAVRIGTTRLIDNHRLSP
ncbi:pantoate--beta-alanine ligase [Prosthecochloris sp. N3]|uniref:Pantothenate synthetase n=1 Tax=Prosthecochloris ethylica TaxID=2743976 RepID=A0ABR9XQ03_9CHLB|nr:MULTISPECIES: pantoate--beta-alanine ligase [Prosthecochloris]MBF0586508.1 pantoate--beta-alanine ligase [Prosthecochloris ethylica]MBF0636121.1 pantoate--beta-alanine ligase [Prosthecochloris ethylica]NUK47742.1 pantoate--beta-alanine ligase [Prosthecochloris ethylica]RNA64403.1 pantoate--beta-alanine ligase [Prosthecochloris sp. ZM_2]